jgi:hypothetical protein
MKFGNEFWLILSREYISPNLFAVWLGNNVLLWPGRLNAVATGQLIHMLDQTTNSQQAFSCGNRGIIQHTPSPFFSTCHGPHSQGVTISENGCLDLHIVRKHVNNCKGLFKAAGHIHVGQTWGRKEVYCTVSEDFRVAHICAEVVLAAVDKCQVFVKVVLHFRCNDDGITTDFSNCVDGSKVYDDGSQYDFYSIMHYDLYA